MAVFSRSSSLAPDWRGAERLAAARSAVADREPRRGRPDRTPPRRRDAARLGLGPRLAEPDRDRRRRRVGREHGRRSRSAARCLDCVRARTTPGTSASSATRPPPSWPSWRSGRCCRRSSSSGCCPSSCSLQAAGSGCVRPPARRVCAHPALVPRALLGARQAVRAAVVVARAPAGRGPRRRLCPARAARTQSSYGHGTRTAWIAVALPDAGSHAMSAPSMRTPPSATSKRTGMPVRMR